MAKVGEFTELSPVYVTARGTRIGVYLFKGRYFAYRNSCPHQGGPAMEGEFVGNSEVEVREDGSRREYTSTERYNISCPWHGIEYDIETGVCRADRRMRLKSYKVFIEGDEVKVRA